jgi:hypothetical protein
MARPYVHTGPAPHASRRLVRWTTAFHHPYTPCGDAFYVDPTRVVGVALVPTWWQDAGLTFTRTGYGRRVPTRYMVAHADGRGGYRWHRVYAIVAGNSGSAYIIVRGARLFLTPNVSHSLESLTEGR